MGQREGAFRLGTVIVSAVLLFLATNGPSDWAQVWRDLFHPPADARHAVRPGNRLKEKGQGVAEKRQKAKRDFVEDLEKSLRANLENEQGRVAMVQRIFAGVRLDERQTKEV